jgi:hypothetical protein
MWISILLLMSSGPPTPEPVPEVQIAPSKPTLDPPFRWQLQVDELDQVAGNAAPYWIRAGLVIRRVNQKWEQVDFTKISPKMPAKEREELKAIVKKHADAYRLAEQAAVRTRCEWEHPPLTMQSLADPLGLPFEELQTAREMANLLRLRARLALLDGDFDAAARDLRIGLTLARHIRTDQRFVLADLVSVAITTVMLGVVQEWASLPDSPNLYWALTALPAPFIDVRPTIRHELNTIYRSFPLLRELKSRTLIEAEVRSAWRQLFFSFTPDPEKDKPTALKELELTARMALLQAKMLPMAQKELQRPIRGSLLTTAFGEDASHGPERIAEPRLLRSEAESHARPADHRTVSAAGIRSRTRAGGAATYLADASGHVATGRVRQNQQETIREDRKRARASPPTLGPRLCQGVARPGKARTADCRAAGGGVVEGAKDSAPKMGRPA